MIKSQAARDYLKSLVESYLSTIASAEARIKTFNEQIAKEQKKIDEANLILKDINEDLNDNV